MMDSQSRLSADFYRRPTEQVARDLLGKRLVRQAAGGQRLSGIIVEVEAYLARNDLACHSHHGRTKKNASMFLPAGRLYVYPIHSRHCLNVVTELEEAGAAVLIRAIEPCEGIPNMARNRGLPAHALDLRSQVKLTSGPGRLCEALGVDRVLDGIDVLDSQVVWIESAAWRIKASSVVASPRIGISQSQELLLRWFLDGNRFVSGRASDHTRGRTWSFAEL